MDLVFAGKKKDGVKKKRKKRGIRIGARGKIERGVEVWGGGLMKWFPLLFANVKTLFFTSAIFDNIAIWEDSSPAIFSHYKANYS